MRTTKRNDDLTVLLVAWIVGILLFLGVVFAPTSLRATVSGTVGVVLGIAATHRYLSRPRRTHPVEFNNGELRVEAVIVNSPYDEDETQRRVAGIAHTLVACVSRRKYMPREATQALKDISAFVNRRKTNTESPVPVVINVASVGEQPTSNPDFSFINDDDTDVMEAIDVDDEPVIQFGDKVAAH